MENKTHEVTNYDWTLYNQAVSIARKEYKREYRKTGNVEKARKNMYAKMQIAYDRLIKSATPVIA